MPAAGGLPGARDLAPPPARSARPTRDGLSMQRARMTRVSHLGSRSSAAAGKGQGDAGVPAQSTTGRKFGLYGPPDCGLDSIVGPPGPSSSRSGEPATRCRDRAMTRSPLSSTRVAGLDTPPRVASRSSHAAWHAIIGALPELPRQQSWVGCRIESSADETASSDRPRSARAGVGVIRRRSGQGRAPSCPSGQAVTVRRPWPPSPRPPPRAAARGRTPSTTRRSPAAGPRRSRTAATG